MGSLGIGEIVVIAAIVLIIFGPDRLPEIARKGAEIIRKSRAATAELTGSLREEYGDVIAPLTEVREELKGVRRDLTAAASSISKETEAVTDDLRAAFDPSPGGAGESADGEGDAAPPGEAEVGDESAVPESGEAP